MFIILITTSIIVMVTPVWFFFVRRMRGGGGGMLLRAKRGSRFSLRRAIDEFVEFTTIQPDPPALRTIVDFNALALRHDQFYTFTDRTIHLLLSCYVRKQFGWL
jgi:hypothetical protein